MIRFSTTDRLIQGFDQALRTLVEGSTQSHRPNPATSFETRLNVDESRHSSGLMRVNHSGEVCAQALYHGQAFSAKLPNVKQEMKNAAKEEQDHLVWCEERLRELNSRPSILNPLWYSMSFTIGAVAGIAGDQYSLGFVVETEQQVSKHLESHLNSISPVDLKSRAIISQMNIDELQHRDQAKLAGAIDLPTPIKVGMKLISKVMTKLSYIL